MAIIRPTVLVQPSSRDALPEELCEKIDASKRAEWFNFTAVAPNPGTGSLSVPRLARMFMNQN